MQHFSAAHIDTHMGNARCIVSADEKDQVAGSCVGRGYRGGNVVEPLGSQPARIADTALCQHPGYEDGSWIKKIVFNFPVPVDGEEVKELPLETETTVETVVLLEKTETGRKTRIVEK